MVLDADVHQTVEQNSPPEDPGSSTGAVTHQLCYLGRLLNLSVPWRPRLSRELMIRQESSASGGCLKIRSDTRDIARGAASAALLISSGPPSTRGAREPTLGGSRARPGACSSYAGLRAHACLTSAPAPPLSTGAVPVTTSEGSPSLLFETRDGKYVAIVTGPWL